MLNNHSMNVNTMKMTNIRTASGSIFDSDCQMLVNTVNCVGVMGAGLAKQFKERYPAYFDSYVEECRKGRIQTGQVSLYHSLVKHYPPVIVSFPTKQHWKESSKLIYIDKGLAHLRSTLDAIQKNDEFQDISIAIPPLGCGLGGLFWPDVLDLIHDHFEGTEFRVDVYEGKP